MVSNTDPGSVVLEGKELGRVNIKIELGCFFKIPTFILLSTHFFQLFILTGASQIKPTNDYAQVCETLLFYPSQPNSARSSIGAGKVSRFIHGIDKRSVVTKFNAKVSGESWLFT